MQHTFVFQPAGPQHCPNRPGLEEILRTSGIGSALTHLSGWLAAWIWEKNAPDRFPCFLPLTCSQHCWLPPVLATSFWLSRSLVANTLRCQLFGSQLCWQPGSWFPATFATNCVETMFLAGGHQLSPSQLAGKSTFHHLVCPKVLGHDLIPLHADHVKHKH